MEREMSTVMGRRVGVVVSVLVGLSLLLFASVASAAPVETVTNNADSGAGSLRYAIAHVDPGGKVVIPASVGEITLTTGSLAVERSMTIEGAGSATTAISGNSANRVFFISNTNPTVTIKGVQITGGKISAPGSEAIGAGIWQHGGSLTVEDSLIVANNLEGEDADGAGIASEDSTSLTLRNTVVSDNRGVSSRSFGGGVYVSGAALTVEGGSIKGNLAEGAEAYGGGIFFTGSKATLAQTTISGDEVVAFGANVHAGAGGIATNGSTGDSLEGVTIAHDKVTVKAPTTAGEAGGGGALLGGAATSLTNTTIADNTVSVTASNAAVALGGGLGVSGTTKFDFSTVSDNGVVASATNRATQGGNLAVYDPNSVARVENTIVADGTGESPAYTNCYVGAGSAIVSKGHNIDDTNQCGFAGPGDQVNTNPNLLALAMNGGPVETVGLAPGSAAIDAGAASGCPATDARGVLRPAGGGCDVGAFELATPSAVTTAAEAVGATAATLTGNATNPDLAPGTVSFQFGTALGYGSPTPTQLIGATTRGARFVAPIADLAPNTTYHYRLVVTDSAGTSLGPDVTFTTAAPPRTLIGGHGGPLARLIAKHLNGLRFRLTCQGERPCRGNVVARHGAGKKGTVVAKAKVSLGSGQTKTLTLKPTAKGKRLLAAPGKLAVVVKFTLRGVVAPKPPHLKLG
jgi:hypothetical protein